MYGKGVKWGCFTGSVQINHARDIYPEFQELTIYFREDHVNAAM
jgi:hypothetical protein